MKLKKPDVAGWISNITMKQVGLVMIGFLMGSLLLLTARFVAYSPESIHYHANFALYINDKRDPFESFTFYEEVQACSDNNADNVKARAHMHDKNNGLIHVHGPSVTWGDFFANLGYGLTDKAIVTDQGVFADTDTAKLRFILNGEPVTAIANKVIKSKDSLLVSYGGTDSVKLQSMSLNVPDDAVVANTKPDPATCSGGDSEPTFTERLRAAIGLEVTSSH